jgi:adenine/guanine phosphoribosyltransferase-like PRPP-binding protein
MVGVAVGGLTLAVLVGLALGVALGPVVGVAVAPPGQLLLMYETVAPLTGSEWLSSV